MKRLSFIILGLILFATSPVMAADCPALVKQALAATDSMCRETGKNQACYGNINLTAKPNVSAENFRFEQPGDLIDIHAIKSLQLSPMTLDTGEWGVALMNVEANRPSAKSVNLTLLAFGDVTLENAGALPTMMDVNVLGRRPINVRSVPNLKAGVVGTVKPNQSLQAIERLADTTWLRVKALDSDLTGWVKTDFMGSTGDLSTLNIVDGNQPYYGSMQAFTFKSGSSTQNCAEVPQDGLIIQTPEGAGEVQLWINQVVVKMGSTIYFGAQADGDMTVTALEGHATVNAFGVTQTAVAGTQVRIKMDSDLNPIAGPTVPEAYTMDNVVHLPVDLLQRKVTIHKPLTKQEIAQAQATSCPTCNGNKNQDCPGNSCGQGNGNGNKPDCPGNSCHDQCPGNSCNNGNGNGNSNGGGKPGKNKIRHE